MKASLNRQFWFGVVAGASLVGGAVAASQDRIVLCVALMAIGVVVAGLSGVVVDEETKEKHLHDPF